MTIQIGLTADDIKKIVAALRLMAQTKGEGSLEQDDLLELAGDLEDVVV